LPNQERGYASLLGEPVLVVGVGRESFALARKLRADNPDQVLVALDSNPGDAAGVWEEEFPGSVVIHFTGADREYGSDLSGCTRAVISPGIPKTGELYRFVASLNIPHSSGSALFVWDNRDSLVGVTGSKGKSTTSALTHHLLVHSGVDAALAGNMGIPVWGIEPAEMYVIELSSYQCHYLHNSPRVVVLTALFPEHLDWHGSEQEYYDDKLGIAQDDGVIVIANADDPVLSTELVARYPDREITWVGAGHAWHLEPDPDGGSWFVHHDTRLGHTRDLALLGEHNQQNALLALAAASATGQLNALVIEQALRSFAPLPHRLQLIEDPSGVWFVNDSLATNPQATVSALRALGDSGVILLVGGTDRGVDYQVLVDQIVDTPPRAVLGLPDSGHTLVTLFGAALAAAGLADSVVLEPVAGMREAVVRARALAKPGDYVVLSPGAPSFGHYRDYAHRAQDFMDAHNTTKEGTP